MVRVLFLVGVMVKSEHFILNQENKCMSSMMPTLTVLLLCLPQVVVLELFLVVKRVKLEFGELDN